ncbi:hypothetical protein [Ammoniphilus sp. 3BR4]|uniref:hypothetical protein n=1 Tax=Ammoniphilus sp. 3BR4 TaxID=3158265 RepID=UPI003466B82A
MGIGERNHRGCSMIGLAVRSKGIRADTKEDEILKAKVPPPTKTRPACPLMAMIMTR